MTCRPWRIKEHPHLENASQRNNMIKQAIFTWVWVNTYRDIFSGMNIHLPAILGFTRYQGFDPSPHIFTVYCNGFNHLQPTWKLSQLMPIGMIIPRRMELWTFALIGLALQLHSILCCNGQTLGWKINNARTHKAMACPPGLVLPNPLCWSK